MLRKMLSLHSLLLFISTAYPLCNDAGLLGSSHSLRPAPQWGWCSGRRKHLAFRYKTCIKKCIDLIAMCLVPWDETEIEMGVEAETIFWRFLTLREVVGCLLQLWGGWGSAWADSIYRHKALFRIRREKKIQNQEDQLIRGRKEQERTFPFSSPSQNHASRAETKPTKQTNLNHASRRACEVKGSAF